MGGIVGYDPIRLQALRSRVAEAITALGELSSWDPEATAALATVGRARNMLETDHLAAVDEALASDAMERCGFGVRFGSILSALVGLVDRERHGLGARRFGSETGLEELTDDRLLDYVFDQIDHPTDWQIDHLHDVEEADRWSTELMRRLDGPGGRELAAALLARFSGDDRDALRYVAEHMAHLVGVARHDPNYGDPEVDPELGIGPFGDVLLRLADVDADFESWLLATAGESHTVARIVVDHEDVAGDPELLETLAVSVLTDPDGTIASEWGVIDSAAVILSRTQDDPDIAAGLLAESDVLEVLLTDDRLDAAVVGAVISTGLHRPVLQRAGTVKPSEQFDEEFVQGLEVWRHAVAVDADGRLTIGAARGISSSLLVYLPSFAAAVRPVELGDGDSADELAVTAMVDDGTTVELGTYGDFGAVFGYMTTDPQAAAALDGAMYEYTAMLMGSGVATAKSSATGRSADAARTIGRATAPAVRFNDFVNSGIGEEEEEQQEEHRESERWQHLGADILLEGAKLAVFRKPSKVPGTTWELATTPADKVLDDALERLVYSPAPTLSRRIPLNFDTEYRALLFESLLRTDEETRRSFGLGAVPYETWGQLLLAVGRFEEDREQGNEDIRAVVGEHLTDPVAIELSTFHDDVVAGARATDVIDIAEMRPND